MAAAGRSPPPVKPTIELEDFLCFAIYTAGHAFNRVYKPLLAELDLTYPQYLVMVALWLEDDQTVGGLGEKLYLESSTLTPLLKRLESAGLVSRKRDKTDERQVRVRLTQKGSAMRAKARTVGECVFEATGMSENALRRLQGDISALRDNLLKSAA